MGSDQSTLLLEEEIPAYVQRDHACCTALSRLFQPGSHDIGLFTEPARFNEAKPYRLTVSDDAWAALKLRVDPLARKLLDPHRSYLGAAFLTLLISAVFAAVRPGGFNDGLGLWFRDGSGEEKVRVGADDDWDGRDDDGLDQFYDRGRDDDFYFNDGVDDDVLLAEMEYRYRENEAPLRMWTIGFFVSLGLLVASTLVLALGQEARNLEYDAKIRNVVEEMKGRFEAEGFSIRYRTRGEVSGMIMGHLRPERIVIFKRIGGPHHRPQSPSASSSVSAADSVSPRSTDAAWGSAPSIPITSETLMVTCPVNCRPGQLLNVSTPSGANILVSVPDGTRPGGMFPVVLPTQQEMRMRSMDSARGMDTPIWGRAPESSQHIGPGQLRGKKSKSKRKMLSSSQDYGMI